MHWESLGNTGGKEALKPHLSQQDDPLHIFGVQNILVVQLVPKCLLYQGLQLLHQLGPLGLTAHQLLEVQPERKKKGMPWHWTPRTMPNLSPQGSSRD